MNCVATKKLGIKIADWKLPYHACVAKRDEKAKEGEIQCLLECKHTVLEMQIAFQGIPHAKIYSS